MNRRMQHPAEKRAPVSAWLLLMLLLGSLFTHAANAAVAAVPPYQAFTTDLSGTLSAQEKAALEQRLREIHQLGVAEIAILLVPTTGGESIFDYSMRVAEQWKVGDKTRDNGLLLVIAKDDRTSQILVGYGLEGSLTDVASSRILRNVIPPFFRRGDFAGGLHAALDAIMSAVQAGQTGTATPSTSQSTRGSNQIDVPPWLIFTTIGWLFFAGSFLRLFFGKLLAGIATVVYALSFGLWAGLPLTALLVFVLFLTMLVAGNRGRRGGGFRMGGGGRSGGGFGGGGGGSFGGGGASGRW